MRLHSSTLKTASILLTLALAACASSATTPPPEPGAGGEPQPSGGHPGSGGHASATGGRGGLPGAGGAGEGGMGVGAGGAGEGGAGEGGAGVDAGDQADTPPPADSAQPADAVETPDAPPLGNGFRHPGVLVTAPQLAFLKAKIAAGAEPWKTAFDKLKASRWGATGYQPKPLAVVTCGAYSNPNIGCSEERDDAIAAYTQALLYAFTGDASYAKTAVAIMNAWAATLTSHTDHNAPLQSAWAAEVWPRAAEIIRYTSKEWAAADVDRFKALLKTVYLPQVQNGSSGNGNWELSMIEAAMGIGIFLDDRAVFTKAVAMWRRRVPAYIYLTSDGPQPVAPPSSPKDIVALWYGQTKFVDGLGQETCRDFGHLTGGFAAMMNAADTAWIQGVDLFRDEAKRLAAGLEFNGQFLDGAAVPAWLCGGKLNLGTNDTWEIGYDNLATRLGMALPHTKAIIAKIRPTGANHHMVWESMTHAEVPPGSR